MSCFPTNPGFVWGLQMDVNVFGDSVVSVMSEQPSWNTILTEVVVSWSGGGITYDRRTDLIVIRGNMTGQRYVNEILRPVVAPMDWTELLSSKMTMLVHTGHVLLLTSSHSKASVHFPGQPNLLTWGAGRSSEVEPSLMVRWVVGSILHGVDPLSYFSFQPVLHDWCNKGRGMCYPVCGMVHIKEPLLLIGKSSPCGGSGFPFSLSEWSLTICLTPYNRR